MKKEGQVESMYIMRELQHSKKVMTAGYKHDPGASARIWLILRKYKWLPLQNKFTPSIS